MAKAAVENVVSEDKVSAIAEDDPEKCLSTLWEMCKFFDGFLKVQFLVVCVKGGTMEPHVVVCLSFIIAFPTCIIFRSVKMLRTANCRMVFATKAWICGGLLNN